jgi:hypothetical protein
MPRTNGSGSSLQEAQKHRLWIHNIGKFNISRTSEKVILCCAQPTSPSWDCFSSLTVGGTTAFGSSCSSSLPNMSLISCFFLGEVAATSPLPRDARELFTCKKIYKFKSKPTKKMSRLCTFKQSCSTEAHADRTTGCRPLPIYAREGR